MIAKTSMLVKAIAAFVLGFAVLSAGQSISVAAPFTVNPGRFDPYKNFKFRVKWDGHYVAGISKVSPLIRRTEVIQFRDGGAQSAPRKSPGRTAFDAITLERGLTHDTDFEQWANQTWQYGAALGSQAALQSFRKDVVLEIYNEAGQLMIAYKIYRCWPSAYQALPELDANSTAVAIQSLTLQCEGWERDTSVVEPLEPK